MPRREETWLKDMLDAARIVRTFVEGQSYESFASDLMRSNATVFQLLIVGEAAKSVSETTGQRYPQIDWRQWKRTRDSIVHSYFSINLKTVWDFANDDFPKLITDLEAILEAEYGAKIEIETWLIKEFGYDEQSANDVLQYVASIFARGDVRK